MNNQKYNDNYNALIEPLYGLKRNIIVDEVLTNENIEPSIYAINERVDMTKNATYSIDPDGCEDAL